MFLPKFSLLVLLALLFFLSFPEARWPPNFNKGASNDPHHHHRPPPPSRHRHRGMRDEPEEVFETSLQNNSNIKEADNKTIDDIIKRERDTICLFINESVKKSNDVVPEFVNLTKFMTKNFYKRSLVYVNSSNEKYLLDKYKITQYPTIIFFIEEKEVDRWEGQFKNKDQMAMHFNYMLNFDTIIDVNTLKQADAMLEEEIVTLVAMITSEEHSLIHAFNLLVDDENVNPKNYPQIMIKGPKLKARLEDPEFFNITDEYMQDYPDVIGVVKNYNNPTIKECHFMKFDVEVARDEMHDEKKLNKKLKVYRDFLKKHTKQAVIEWIKQDNYQDVISIIDPNKPTVLFVFDFSFEKQFRRLEYFLDETFFFIASDVLLKGKFNFLYGSDDQFSDDISRNFLLKKMKFPLMLIQDSNFTVKAPNIYYLYDKKFETVEMIKYLRTYRTKGKRMVPSEPLPKTNEYLNNKEAVRTITTNTFQKEIIEENEKDIFMIFYHHENEFCTNFMTLFESLTLRFPDVLFAKLNFAKNYLENPGLFELNDTVNNLKFQLPKLYFFKKEDKSNPIRYKERKREEDLVEFVSKLHARKEYQCFEEEKREIYELKLKFGVKVDPLPPIITTVVVDLDELKNDL